MRKSFHHGSNNNLSAYMLAEAQALMMSMYNDLYPTGQGIFPPQKMGNFAGVESMPIGEYPAMYCWVDTSRGNQPVISFNLPLLGSISRRLAEQKKAPANPELVILAVRIFVETMSNIFTEMLAEASEELTGVPTQIYSSVIKGR